MGYGRFSAYVFSDALLAGRGGVRPTCSAGCFCVVEGRPIGGPIALCSRQRFSPSIRARPFASSDALAS
jgi:hypothetical protein